jgi:hypothetical protein
MVVNFKARGISRGACKLARTSMLKKNDSYILSKKKKKQHMFCVKFNLFRLTLCLLQNLKSLNYISCQTHVN